MECDTLINLSKTHEAYTGRRSLSLERKQRSQFRENIYWDAKQEISDFLKQKEELKALSEIFLANKIRSYIYQKNISLLTTNNIQDFFGTLFC